MTTINQGMSVEEIERVVAQRVANTIEAIATYETKTNMAGKLMSQTKRQEDKVAKNASNKKKWECSHNGSSSQQNKGHKVSRATLLGQSTKRHMLDLHLYETIAIFTIMDHALNGVTIRTMMCQPITFQIDFPGSNQIQTPQYPEIHPPFQETKEPSQDSDIHQLIEECSTEICEEQKRSMEDTMFELVKICQEKEFLCIHDDVNDLIESALNSKLLLINSNSQLAPIQSTKEPEYLLSMGYEHLSITPKTESNKVTESNAENLLPIPSKCEVTLEDEIECDMPIQDQSFLIFTTFSNHLFNNDDLDSSDDESLPDEDVLAEEFKIYSNPLFDEDEINSDKLDPHCFNVEYDFVESLLNQIPKSDFDFEEEIRFIKNLLYDNSSPRPPEELNAEIADTIVESIPLLPILVQDGNSQQEEVDVVTSTDDVLPPSVENNDDSLNDSLLEEADLFLTSDNSIPPGIENFADDPEGDIRFLEELLIDDFIRSHESSDSNFEDNPSIPRPPPEPPDVEIDAGEEILVVMNVKDKFDEDYHYFIFDKCFLYSPQRVRIRSLILVSPIRSSDFPLGWNFHLLSC
uniref:Reverse transcriptase domain-containing protein n=1 Tax=Tanacetum cinerariifolium TaxID=118510 RepID=A0A6L2KH30_TANCI|nr:hypothetical protein [Tanacetum cinerariifolium]